MSAEEQLLAAVLQTRDAVHAFKEEIGGRLSDGDDRMGRMEVSIDEVKLYQREQNGNVAKALRWQADHDDRIHEAEIVAKTIAAERARMVGHVQRVRAAIEEWSAPVFVAGGALLWLTSVASWLFWWLR